MCCLAPASLTAQCSRQMCPARGYIQKAWYLIDVEAGFELWQGGAGVATDSFAVSVIR